jgi:hypothetical protein
MAYSDITSFTSQSFVAVFPFADEFYAKLGPILPSGTCSRKDSIALAFAKVAM